MTTIDELNRLHEAATKGPWRPQENDEHDIEADSGDVAGNYDWEEGGIVNVEDRDAIVALHNAWPSIHRVLMAARWFLDQANVIGVHQPLKAHSLGPMPPVRAGEPNAEIELTQYADTYDAFDKALRALEGEP